MAPEDNPADEVQPTKEEWDEYERPTVGRVFYVDAWWTKGLVPCRIEHVWEPSGNFDVRPIEGNPHMRYVEASAVRGRIAGHPAELEAGASRK